MPWTGEIGGGRACRGEGGAGGWGSQVPSSWKERERVRHMTYSWERNDRVGGIARWPENEVYENLEEATEGVDNASRRED